MKFQVEVKDEKAKAFQQMLEAMQELKVVRAYRMEAEGESRREGREPSAEEPQPDYANQYRDLVD